jgi:hypothetical protein
MDHTEEIFVRYGVMMVASWLQDVPSVAWDPMKLLQDQSYDQPFPTEDLMTMKRP